MKMKLTISILLSAVALFAQPVVSNNPPLDANYLPNDGSTGTTLGQWLVMNTSGNAVNAGTTVASGVRGVCITGCGTTGMAGFMHRGVWPALLDNSGTAGDWVVPSGSTAGKGHDTGSATRPTSGVVLGQVQGAAAGGMYYVVLDPPDTVAGYTPPVTTKGDIFTYSTAAARQAVGANGAILTPDSAQTTGLKYISFPGHYIIPAANCVSSTAGSGWNTTLTPACVAGSNNLGGILPFVDTSTAQFELELPADWDTTQQPYMNLFFGSGTNTTGTVIFNVATACSKADGSVTVDPAFTTADALATKTMAAASRGWATTAQMTQVTSGNNCIPGGTMVVKITRATDTASAAVNVQKSVITVPRLLTVQAN